MANEEEQIKQLLRFFRSKRNNTTTELSSEFDDLKSSRLDEDMFNRDEVEDMLDSLKDACKANVRDHMEQLAFMACLLVRQLLEESYDEGLELTVNMGRIEDQALLKEVSKIQIDAPSSSKREKKKAAKLNSIGDEHSKIIKENQALKDELEILQQRHKGTMQQCSTLLQEKSQMKKQLKSMDKSLRKLAKSAQEESKRSGMSDEAAAELKELRDEVEQARGRMQGVDEQLEVAKKEAAKKVSDSKQYQQLRKMLATKNKQLRELRERLRKYEPDDTKQMGSDSD